MIETERLILRPWRERDRAAFLALSADPEVMDWLGGVADAAAANERFERLASAFDRQGYGRWAIERTADEAFIGYAGMAPVHGTLPLQGVEIGWGLVRSAWGAGYASEAASAAIRDGFERLGFDEILAYTAATNLRSQAVMRRTGMQRMPERDFDHPSVAADSPLRPHVVYVASNPSA